MTPAGKLAITSALKLNKAEVKAGDTLTATVTYTNTGSAPFELWRITIAGRAPGASHVDGPYADLEPSQDATTLQAGASVTLTASRSFSASDATGKWESYTTYQDNTGAWHDGPSVFFNVALGSGSVPNPDPTPTPIPDPTPTPIPDPTPTPVPPPSGSNTMKIGTNFWYLTPGSNPWSGEVPMKSGINWATAYGPGTNGIGATNIWSDAWIKEIAPYSTLRFMDWGNTNHSKIVSWSQRRLPTAANDSAYIDAGSPENNPGIAYEWMVDLSNRTKKDMWVCLPATADANYWTQLASLLKNKLSPDLKLYVEYSNETWNGSFTQAEYTMERGEANGLPGGNKWYKGQAYAVWQSVKIFKAFEEVFGAAAMGTRVIRVFAYGGNMDTGRQALQSVYKSATWNPNNQKIDMLAVAPYVGSGLDGASANIQSAFHASIDHHLEPGGAEPGMIAFAVQDLKTFGIPKLGAYEGGQHVLKNSKVWTQNPKIYAEYKYMLDRYSQYFTLFVHYSHTGTWTDKEYESSWGALDHTGQPLSEAHKYRALVDWVAAHP